jgi:hypothetical protein
MVGICVGCCLRAARCREAAAGAAVSAALDRGGLAAEGVSATGSRPGKLQGVFKKGLWLVL